MTELEEIKQQALSELKEEKFREAVKKEKERIKSRKSLWDFIPFEIRIIKK